MTEFLIAAIGMSLCVLVFLPYVGAHHWGVYHRTPIHNVCDRNHHLSVFIRVIIALVIATVSFLWSCATLINGLI